MVIWIIGISASGKTTFGKAIHKLLKQSSPNTVFLDGDMIRNVMGGVFDHTMHDRKRNADCISRLCYELDKQGLNVVCSILSIFHESQAWNRANISKYKEIYLEIDVETATKRETKGIYRKAREGSLQNVVGVDVEFPPPYAPDVVIDNRVSRDSIEILSCAHSALNQISDKPIRLMYPYTRDNILEEPERYQYPEFYGKAFLDAYRSSRAFAIHRLRQQCLNQDCGLNASAELLLAGPAGVPLDVQSLFGESTLPSAPLDLKNKEIRLYDFLYSFLSCTDNLTLDEWKQELLVLLRRFEIRKRLYTVYRYPGWKKADTRGPGDTFHYALFLLALGRLAFSEQERTIRLLLLNTILKLGDIIASQSLKGMSRFSAVTSLLALEMERTLIDAVEKV